MEAALGSALGLLAAEPDLAWALTIEPELGDEVAIRRRQRWKQRYGALLRQAAEEDPEIPSRPPFLEPALVGGIRRLIAQQVLCGEAERLEELLWVEWRSGPLIAPARRTRTSPALRPP